MSPEIFTIGHSNLPFEVFASHLKKHRVSAVVDVRSVPQSRRYPQYNKETLRARLKELGIEYVFLGKELGGRPTSAKLKTSEGKPDYEKMAVSKEFKEGMKRVLVGAREYKVALLCSEGDPLECHRTLLISPKLADRGVDVTHILRDGALKSQSEFEETL